MSQEGLSVVVGGQEHKFHGTVTVTLCDTQAAHQLVDSKLELGLP